MSHWNVVLEPDNYNPIGMNGWRVIEESTFCGAGLFRSGFGDYDSVLSVTEDTHCFTIQYWLLLLLLMPGPGIAGL